MSKAAYWHGRIVLKADILHMAQPEVLRDLHALLANNFFSTPDFCLYVDVF